MAQIRPITSEAIEATIRNLLPSQNGFGEDMQAQNVIVPIIDITPTAEGSQLPQALQQAFGYDDITTFNVSNTTTAIVNTPGFWRIHGTGTIIPNATTGAGAKIQLNNGLATKDCWLMNTSPCDQAPMTTAFDFIVFLTTGDTLQASCDVLARICGSVRQVATVNGTTVNPTGFSFQ